MQEIVPAFNGTPLDGEVLTAKDDVSVYVAPHPLRDERVVLKVAAGSTIAEIVEFARRTTGSKASANKFVVYIEGHPIPPHNWRRVRPKPGVKVAMRPVAEGFISAIFGAIGSAISGLTAALGGLGIFGKLLMAGLTLGAKLLLNKLFAPKQKRQELTEPKVGYSLTGSRNQAAPFSPIPVILGEHRVVPFLGASPYTEIVGSDQYLRMLFVVGYGPLNISDIRIGETAISQFQDVSYQIRYGFVADEQTSLYPAHVVEEPLQVELKNVDGFQTRTTGEDVVELQVDLVWPNGLTWIGDNGARNPMGANIAWRYRKVGAPSWTDGPTLGLTLATQDTVRRTMHAFVSEGQYEVQVMKASPDVANNQVVDDVSWTALRGIRTGEPITFDDPITVIALRIRATSQLNGVVDTLNCLAQSFVTAWDEAESEWVVDTISRSPADLFRHVLQCAANKRPEPDERIDLVSLQNWKAYCTLNGWTYDKPITSVSSVYDTLQEICTAGRAMPVFRDGKWSVVWDEQDTPVVQMFTPRNSWGFEAQQDYVDLPHAFRVRFVNAAKGYIEDERIVYDDGYDEQTAERFEGFEVPGVTNSDAIWKHGRFHIAQLRLRPATYTLNVDFEGLVLTRNDRVRVQHDVMLVGLGAFRVKSVDVGAQTVTVDELLALDPSVSHQMRFRLADGSFLTRTVAAGTGGELRVIPLSGTADLPVAGDLGTYGVGTSDSAVYRVFGIEPQDNHIHRLTLVDDAPEIYLADTGDIPEFNSNVTAPVDPFTLPPVDLRLIDGAHEESEQFFEFLTASWKLPRAGRVATVEVEYQASADEIWHQTAALHPSITSTTIRRLLPGNYTVRVRSIFDDGTFSAWNTSAVYSATALLNPPADVTNFRTSTTGDVMTLSWDEVLGVGNTSEIRFAPSEVASPTWNTATPLLVNVSGSSVQVPPLIGTYFIKAKKPTGVYSVNAASIVTSIAALIGFNVVSTLTESPIFAGDKDGVESVDGELRLQQRNVMANWETLADVVSLYEGDGDDDSVGYETFGVYEFDNELDLGGVYTSRVTATIDAYGFDPAATMSRWLRLADVNPISVGDPIGWGLVLEYRSTNDDPIANNWSEWQQFFVGDITFRAIQFRLKLFGRVSENILSEYVLTTPSVRGLAVKIDMPDEDRIGNDIVVGTGGMDIIFDPAFAGPASPAIAIAAQDMLTGDKYTITSKARTGFHIVFQNSGGSGVSRTFDYHAKGYGRVAA